MIIENPKETKLHSFCRKKSLDSTLPQIVRKPSLRQYQSTKQHEKQLQEYEKTQKMVSEFKIPNSISSMASNFVSLFYTSPPPPTVAATQLPKQTSMKARSSIEEERIFHQHLLSKPPKKGILKKKGLFSPEQQYQQQPEMQDNSRSSVDIGTIRESLLEASIVRGGDKKSRLKWSLESTSHHETFSSLEYERGGVEYVAKRLSPLMAMMIKIELNEVKHEMPIHEDSRKNTQFYNVK